MSTVVNVASRTASVGKTGLVWLGIALLVFAAVLLGSLFTVSAQDGGLIVRVDGVALPPGHVLSIVVDSDAVNPDAAVIALMPGRAPLDTGRAISIASVDGRPVFQGEVVDAIVSRSGASPVTIRASNRLHRLTRERHTRTFDNLSDAGIARRIAFDAGLHAETSGTVAEIEHDHVYQHNQTDLEFILERAARIGYEVFADDTTLHFQKRRESSPIAVGCQPNRALLKTFLARLSSTASVNEVTVRGWDPANAEPIVARARQTVIPLSASASRIDPPPLTMDLGFVETLPSGAAAHAAAAGALSAITAGRLSGEMEIDGTPALRPGARVALQGAGSRFDGEYYITAVRHQYAQGKNGGYHTLLRGVRADRALFVLPEVGDEVLVAFEHGDLAHPIVVGSLWDGDAPPDASPCDAQTRPRR